MIRAGARAPWQLLPFLHSCLNDTGFGADRWHSEPKPVGSRGEFAGSKGVHIKTKQRLKNVPGEPGWARSSSAGSWEWISLLSEINAQIV